MVKINRITTYIREIPVLKVLGLNPNGITERKYRETPINKGFLDISYKEIRVPFLVLISKFEPQNRRKIAAKMAQKAKIAAKSPQNRRKKTGSKLTQKRPDEGLYIDARIGSSINNLKKFIKMATISIEFGKESSQKTREVYLLVRQGKTRQRVKTGTKSKNRSKTQ